MISLSFLFASHQILQTKNCSVNALSNYKREEDGDFSLIMNLLRIYVIEQILEYIKDYVWNRFENYSDDIVQDYDLISNQTNCMEQYDAKVLMTNNYH